MTASLEVIASLAYLEVIASLGKQKKKAKAKDESQV
jgi:hypothetical protein